MSRRHRIKGPNPEERSRMVSDAIKHMGKLIGPATQESDLDRLIKSAKQKLSEVNSHLNEIDQRVRSAGLSHDRAFLQETAQKMLLERFMSYKGEELLLILVCLTTDLAVREIV